MEINEEQLTALKNKFISISDIDSLVEFFCYSQNLWEEAKPKYKPNEIRKKAVAYYIYKKKDRYQKFTIRKKNGKEREINAPNNFLKKLQRHINFALQSIHKPNPVSFGFIPNKNIVMNAQVHVANRFVYNIDLKDFFPSTHFGRILAVLQIEPFHISRSGALLIANLVCEEGALPQGAPSSPTLTNIVCQRLDRKLFRLSRDGYFNYSRYADDITFSSNNDIFSESLKGVIQSIIEKEGYKVNPEKERLQTSKQRQEVTGIIVNKKCNVARKYIKKIRAALHDWEKNGFEKANSKFARFYISEKGFIRHKGKIPPFANVLSGQIEYLGMVRGKDDVYFTKFKNQLQKLTDDGKSKN